MHHDIRWMQRFDNYKLAYQEFKEAVDLAKTRELSKLEKQGLIQEFEYTHELAWKTLKDYLSYKGISGLIASRDSCREAFKQGIITQAEVWMEMIKARNLTSHTYNQALADQIYKDIKNSFYPVLTTFTLNFEKRLHNED